VRLAVVLFAFLMGEGCDPPELPPRGEALFIVDTDVAPSSLVSQLRVDVYREDGTWIDSRSFTRMPDDWPASFEVYNPDMAGTRVAVVRLRVYPEGVERDYHGERYMPPPSPTPPAELVPEGDPTPNEGPRLIVGGKDATPRTEPSPFAAIDRLVRVRLSYGTRGAARVTLHGECFGRMADVAHAQSCISASTAWTGEIDQALDPDMHIGPKGPTPFGARLACKSDLRAARPGLFEEEVCVPGGAFLFGDIDGFGDGIKYATVPERIARLSPFRMDRWEVTVGRFRAAVEAGFSADPPQVNDGPLLAGLQTECTYTSARAMREDFPLNCVSMATARAFCEWSGGSLPSEAQWKWAAQAAERQDKTRYPWGDDPPDCAQVVYGRDPLAGDSHVCAKLGTSPQSETTSMGDTAIGTGAVNMAGNVAEMLLDAFYSFGARCWAFPQIDDPECIDDTATFALAAGAAWDDAIETTLSRSRRGHTSTAVSTEIGFRCVRGM
jgi:formylglycine-generating enzyme required for sulfatase activity